jgi:hypothetical protein
VGTTRRVSAHATCATHTMTHTAGPGAALILRARARVPSMSRTSGASPGYAVDHVKAPKRGDADAPSNMHWQTVQDAKADGVGRRLAVPCR